MFSIVSFFLSCVISFPAHALRVETVHETELEEQLRHTFDIPPAVSRVNAGVEELPAVR